MAIDTNKVLFEALTYDDVLLLPAFSEVLPKDTQTKTQLTRNISVNIPLVSAAMDTVTEWQLAEVMAQQGGMGIIHKNMSIAQQAEQVRKVKRSESGMILDPVTLRADSTLQEAVAMMREYKVGGIPIVDENRKLVGIVTNRDLRFIKNLNQPVSAAMTVDNLITAKRGISLDEAEQILQKYRIEKLPILNDGGELVGLITYKDITKRQHHPYSCKDQFGRLRVAAAVGATGDVLERVEALVNASVDVISLDTAHGHHINVLNAVREVKKAFPDVDVIAGNVATGAGAKALVDAGADAVKVGVGPGSICTTRVIAGVGMPQLTAVMEAAKALEGTGVPIIADGGVRFSGDLAKAIAGGASTIMIGSLLAGTAESPGDIILYEGRRFKQYRGMGSLQAMEDGSKDRYFQAGEGDNKKLVPEGIVGRVPYKGSVSEVLYQLVGGLKSGMGYCGAADIKAMQQSNFVKITSAGVAESHPHDVMITREAPNYSKK